MEDSRGKTLVGNRLHEEHHRKSNFDFRNFHRKSKIDLRNDLRLIYVHCYFCSGRRKSKIDFRNEFT